MTKNIIPLLTLILIWILFSSTLTAKKSSLNPDAIVLKREITYKISSEKKAEMIVKEKIRVFNKEGKKHCRIMIVETKFIKFEYFNGYVYDVNEALLEDYTKDDAAKICGFSGYALYTDICHWRYSLTASEYPFTCEYEYKIKHNSLFFWPDWFPQDEIPVDTASFTLIVPNDIEFKYLEYGEPGEPNITDMGKEKKYTWNLVDIPADDDLKYVPAEYLYAIGLRFSPQKFKFGKYKFDASSWATLAKDGWFMSKDCFKINDEQKKLMEQFEHNSIYQSEICNKLHEEMIKKTRYVAIEIGIGGWQPYKSEETFSRGYGDCKDLATMYSSMLQQAGIIAHQADILTKHKGWNDPKFPTMNNFNHQIFYAIVDNDTIWMDPTCQDCAFGDLLWYDENTYALAVDPNAGVFLPTPKSTPEDNIISRKAEVTINKNKSIDLDIHFAFKGNPAHGFEEVYFKTDKEEFELYLQSDLPGLSAKVNVTELIYDKDKTQLSHFEITAKGNYRKAINSVGEKQYLNISFLEPFRYRELFDFSERNIPLDLKYPFSYNDMIIINFPTGWSIYKIPQNVSYDTKYGSLELDFKIDDDKLIISRVKKNKLYQIDSEDLASFESYIDSLKKVIPEYIVLKKE